MRKRWEGLVWKIAVGVCLGNLMLFALWAILMLMIFGTTFFTLGL